jgi:hypothetical protein
MGQIIWTNHLRERLRERQVDPKLVELTLKFPDRVEKSKTENSEKFSKNFETFQVIAAVKHQGNDWIVTSVWQKQGRYIRNRPLIERLVYNLVVTLENLLRGRSNR